MAMAALQAFLFVLMGVWVRMMNQSFTVPQQVFWRMLLASLLAWIFFHRKFTVQIINDLTKKDWFTYWLRAVLNYGVGVMLFTVAINNTNLSTVSFISSLPILGVLAWLMFREKFALGAIPFVLLSIVGLVLVTKLSPSNLHLGIGEIAAIIGTLGFDISWLMVRYHPKRMTNFQNTTLMLSFAWMIPLVYMVIISQPIMPGSITVIALIGLMASAIFNIFGLYILNYIFKNLKGYVAGNILLLEGVFALIIGTLFYGEVTALTQLVGALLIAGCAVVVAKIESQPSAMPSTDYPATIELR